VGWWPGDGNTKDLASGNTGLLKNGASFGTGEVAQAFSFNGSSQYVDIVNNPPELNVSQGDFTLDAWVNFNVLTGDQPILDKMHNGNQDGWRLIKQSDNRFWFCMGLPGNQCGNGSTTLFSTTHVTTGTWYHVAVTRASGTLTMYVNGAFESNVGTPV